MCLSLHSKVDCVRSCAHSHTPLQGQSWGVVLRYTRICRDTLDPSKKRKCNGDGDQGSYGGHWERRRGNGTMQNSEGQNYWSGAGCGGGIGGHVDGR